MSELHDTIFKLQEENTTLKRRINELIDVVEAVKDARDKLRERQEDLDAEIKRYRAKET